MAFNEDARVKIPALLHLFKQDYNYISLNKSTWDIETNILLTFLRLAFSV